MVIGTSDRDSVVPPRLCSGSFDPENLACRPATSIFELTSELLTFLDSHGQSLAQSNLAELVMRLSRCAVQFSSPRTLSEEWLACEFMTCLLLTLRLIVSDKNHLSMSDKTHHSSDLIVTPVLQLLTEVVATCASRPARGVSPVEFDWSVMQLVLFVTSHYPDSATVKDWVAQNSGKLWDEISWYLTTGLSLYRTSLTRLSSDESELTYSSSLRKTAILLTHIATRSYDYSRASLLVNTSKDSTQAQTTSSMTCFFDTQVERVSVLLTAYLEENEYMSGPQGHVSSSTSASASSASASASSASGSAVLMRALMVSVISIMRRPNRSDGRPGTAESRAGSSGQRFRVEDGILAKNLVSDHPAFQSFQKVYSAFLKHVCAQLSVFEHPSAGVPRPTGDEFSVSVLCLSTLISESPYAIFGYSDPEDQRLISDALIAAHSSELMKLMGFCLHLASKRSRSGHIAQSDSSRAHDASRPHDAPSASGLSFAAFSLCRAIIVSSSATAKAFFLHNVDGSALLLDACDASHRLIKPFCLLVIADIITAHPFSRPLFAKWTSSLDVQQDSEEPLVGRNPNDSSLSHGSPSNGLSSPARIRRGDSRAYVTATKLALSLFDEETRRSNAVDHTGVMRDAERPLRPVRDSTSAEGYIRNSIDCGHRDSTLNFAISPRTKPSTENEHAGSMPPSVPAVRRSSISGAQRSPASRESTDAFLQMYLCSSTGSLDTSLMNALRRVEMKSEQIDARPAVHVFLSTLLQDFAGVSSELLGKRQLQTLEAVKYFGDLEKLEIVSDILTSMPSEIFACDEAVSPVHRLRSEMQQRAVWVREIQNSLK